MGSLLPEKKPALDGPLGEAVEIIEKLRALCSKNGLKREADSIVTGKEIAEPSKRSPGRPLVKSDNYRRALAGLLEIEALGPQGRRGARTRLALAFAEAEGVERKNSPTWRSRVRQFQNDLSRLTPGETIEAAYYMRRIKAGEAFETAKARLDAALAGESDAARKVFDTVRDLVPRASHINSKK